ncbi:MAG TPA: L-lactate dehydrogenase [Pyrinomonadaceae bacterium]|jgi:L-lactate dehydrogenase|nr:L-lactate dehydrogenase [Pyrinomonadaceae bacterium]
MNNNTEANEQTQSEESAPAVHANRVCIIGCGNVGTASAYAIAQSQLVRELVLIDADHEKAEGETMDLQQAVSVPMEPPVKIINGTYKDAANSSVVVVTAGVASSDPNESRLALLGKNVGIIRDIVGRLKAEKFGGILVMTTNPVDVLAQVAQEESGLPVGQVISTGTVIDTARLRGMLAEELGVEPRAVDAYIIGEHGDSEIAVWSAARVAGLPLAKYPGADRLPPRDQLLRQVRRAAPEIVKRKGHTAFAIGMCVRRICEAVLRNERTVLAVSTMLRGEYGVEGVYLGTPCVVGLRGVGRVIELELDEEERAGLHASATVLRETIEGLRSKKGEGAAAG